MQYLITFLEGVISFISPCILPLLPLYISYFAGNSHKKHKTAIRALGFVIGFTLIFTLLGLFAGTLGSFLKSYQTTVNIVTGLIVIVFGLQFLNIIKIPFLKGASRGREVKGFFSALLFGVIYSISLTPCVGAFLGSALMLASVSATAAKGTLLLLIYSLGLGVPFLISALLIEKLSNLFTFIKKHYRIINVISGIFLIIIGVLMSLGFMNKALSIFL